MHASRLVQWEDRLTRLSLVLLIVAAALGVFGGAVITMYYTSLPDLTSVENSLARIVGIAFLLAQIASLVHLVFAVWDIRHRQWRQALIRAALGFAPLIVFLGTDGLLAHFLWWGPLSDTGRYHMLHHSLFAGVPLTLGFWLMLRALYQPALLAGSPPLTARGAVMAGLVLIPVIMLPALLVGVLMMGLSAVPIVGTSAVVGAIALFGLWWQSH